MAGIDFCRGGIAKRVPALGFLAPGGAGGSGKGYSDLGSKGKKKLKDPKQKKDKKHGKKDKKGGRTDEQIDYDQDDEEMPPPAAPLASAAKSKPRPTKKEVPAASPPAVKRPQPSYSNMYSQVARPAIGLKP